jgi:hypothetical protein
LRAVLVPREILALPGNEATPPKGPKQCIPRTRKKKEGRADHNNYSYCLIFICSLLVLYFFNKEMAVGVCIRSISMACAGCHVSRLAEGAGAS